MALLESPTLNAAAAKAGCSKATLRRGLAEEAFLAAYRAARRELMGHTAARLQASAAEALDALRAIIADADAPAAARVTAARTVLEMATRTAETEELSERVAKLEAAALATEETWA
ncbi:MAG: hypothetical protein HY904_01935 [Deltaproteobacteria bacterium]|nr:hypothetical protein [Deltaproteobacteria bacterium]